MENYSVIKRMKTHTTAHINPKCSLSESSYPEDHFLSAFTYIKCAAVSVGSRLAIVQGRNRY